MSERVTLRLSSYTTAARTHVASAQAVADERGHTEVLPLHLLMELCARSDASRAAITRAGLEPDDVLVEGELRLRHLPHAATGDAQAYLSPRLLELLGRAEGEAARGGASVDVAHLLLATSQEPDGEVRSVMRACGLSAPLVRAALESERDASPAGPAMPDGEPAPGGRTPAGRDLTRLAAEGALDPVVGRDAELRRVLQVLTRRRQSSPLLVGEPGVGRRSIVHALAQRIARGDVPSMLTGKRIVALEPGKLLAGARLRGEAEQRMAGWLSSVRDSAGEVIIFCPDLPGLVSERSAGMLADLLADALAAGDLRLLAVTDPAGLLRLRGEQPALAAQLVPIDVETPDRDETIAILRGVVERYEADHGLQITDPALVAAADLARRYLPSAQLPRAAVELIDEAAARLRVEMDSLPADLDRDRRRLERTELQLLALSDDHDAASATARAQLEQQRAALAPEVERQLERFTRQQKLLRRLGELRGKIAAVEREVDEAEAAGDRKRQGELRFTTLPDLRTRLQEASDELHADAPLLVREAVSAEDVAAVVAERTGIPVTRMLEEETRKLIDLEGRLGQRVIGQPEAVGAISRAIRRGRVGLRDPGRPIGSFLFLGSSGVGKTELAKAVAALLFDDEHALTRLDMSEFMEKHTVSRLLGSPPGYVGSEEGGFLTEAVRRRPYSVVLFDEIEKAHPDVFDILLQVLDDGRLTDSRGQLAHFSDTVIVLTSNIGSHLVLERGMEGAGLEEAMRTRLLEHLRPEFVNRIDEVVIFSPLSREDLDAILTLELRKLERLLAPRQVSLTLDDSARAHVVALAYDPAFGARPLKRVIQRELADPLALAILEGGYGEGDAITATVTAGELRLLRAQGAGATADGSGADA